MKTLTAMTMIMATALSLTSGCAAHATREQWVMVHDDPALSAFYFDRATVAKSADGMTTVWTKAVYSAEGKADALDTIGHPKGFEDLTNTGFLYTINCPGEMSRLEKVVHFDSKGGKIREFDLSGKTGWEEIYPETRMSLLQDEVCK